LTNGTSYTFTVTATNAAGDGAPSAPSAAATPRTVPDAPSGVSAEPGDTQALVSFSPPAFDGGAPITSYTVTSSPDGKTVTGAGSPLLVTGLTNGTGYTFTVTATNAAGDGAPSAPSAAATPRTVPDAPSGVSALPRDTQALVSFSPPAFDGGAPITSYTVTSSPDGETVTGFVSPLLVTGLTDGTSYTFTVTAHNAAGESAASAASNAVVPLTAGAPGAATGVTATPGNGRAEVAFTPPASDGGAPITSYTVTASPGGQTATASGSPVTVTGLSNGQSYTFTVTATNSVGAGPTSALSEPIVVSGTGRSHPAPPAESPRPPVPDFTPRGGPRPPEPG
jgi:predicted RNA-binding protein with TRAM domain